MSKDHVAPKRHRGRELITVLLAFAFAAIIGRGMVVTLKSPPFVVSLFIFLLLYIALYLAFWRVTALYFR